MLGGTFRIEPANAQLLLALLPNMIHLRAAQNDTTRLSRVIDLIREECTENRQGQAMILERLLEILLLESLRWRVTGRDAIPPGLLAGMRDPAIAVTLRAMHADIRHRWTVAELARRIHKSRSSFAARFAKVVGCGPLEYLSRWRMSVAMDALGRDDLSLEQLADRIGYQSASAFSTAFSRRIGCAPRTFARSRRQGLSPDSMH
jgi:AraC-like DNA-binding protein